VKDKEVTAKQCSNELFMNKLYLQNPDKCFYYNFEFNVEDSLLTHVQAGVKSILETKQVELVIRSRRLNIMGYPLFGDMNFDEMLMISPSDKSKANKNKRIIVIQTDDPWL
jgi:hypothetical protein